MLAIAIYVEICYNQKRLKVGGKISEMFIVLLSIKHSKIHRFAVFGKRKEETLCLG